MHYTIKRGATVDGFYITEDLKSHKMQSKNFATPFTDHLAVLFRLNMGTAIPLLGRKHWKLNNNLPEKNAIMCKSSNEHWVIWRQQNTYKDTGH